MLLKSFLSKKKTTLFWLEVPKLIHIGALRALGKTHPRPCAARSAVTPSSQSSPTKGGLGTVMRVVHRLALG